ncbi:MAG TPA: sigma factor-like helix-turn-helix DNA-binding protein [Candidatus Paceibacterota bacterium]|nr:sigma factor-like helix-turn-helix DNA-binding protein [Candidatus Paceibacterota bacterium]
MPQKTKLSSKKTAVSATLSFDSVSLVKKLLAEVPERARDVLVRRFGLGTATPRETLESIGSRAGITRERVRQIEHAGLEAARASKTFHEAEALFEELRRHILAEGGIVSEDHLLGTLASDERGKNRFRFLLVVGSTFFRERETDDFYARWHVDAAIAEQVHAALSRLYDTLPDQDVVPESVLLDRFIEELKGVNDAYRDETILKRWLSLSKRIGSNPLAEWGRTTSSSVRTKGVRDYAYLAIKRAGKPMHFSEVAKAIGELFSKKAHVATTHNELIKDKRFVLVGRGLYALTEWGYAPGVVRDVIREVLERDGPLTKEDVLTKVKEARFVKDNTILVNLNDPQYFKRQKDGTYTPVS